MMNNPFTKSGRGKVTIRWCEHRNRWDVSHYFGRQVRHAFFGTERAAALYATKSRAEHNEIQPRRRVHGTITVRWCESRNRWDVRRYVGGVVHHKFARTKNEAKIPAAKWRDEHKAAQATGGVSWVK